MLVNSYKQKVLIGIGMTDDYLHCYTFNVLHFIYCLVETHNSMLHKKIQCIR